MDFTFSINPRLAYAPPERLKVLSSDYWLYWAEQIGNVALPAAGGRFLQAGRLFSTSFRFKPSPLPLGVKLALPFSIVVQQPGLLHLALDVAWYKGTGPAFAWTQEQYKLLMDWINNVDRASVENAIGPAAFDELTNGGKESQIRVIVEMPPAWLTDP